MEGHSIHETQGYVLRKADKLANIGSRMQHNQLDLRIIVFLIDHRDLWEAREIHVVVRPL